MTTRHELRRYLAFYGRLVAREIRALHRRCRQRLASRRALAQQIACLEAVNKALYQTIDTMTRAAVAAGVDYGFAEGTEGALALEAEHREILGEG